MSSSSTSAAPIDFLFSSTSAHPSVPAARLQEREPLERLPVQSLSLIRTVTSKQAVFAVSSLVRRAKNRKRRGILNETASWMDSNKRPNYHYAKYQISISLTHETHTDS